MSAERIWANSTVAGLLLLAALLIFPNLDDRYLWDDEAETALLAKNVLRFGVPVAWDGVSLISQECGSDYDINYLWRQTPWLPIYLTAASFALLDAGTFTARLPFALLGLLCVPSMYVLARRVFADRATALIAAGSLLLSVPFLLHVRQCRYYSVAIFAAIWILYFFFSLRRSPRLAAAGLALALSVLLHTSQLLFFGAAAGLALGFLIVVFDRAVLPWLTAALVAPVLVNLPWLLASDLGGKSRLLLSLNSVVQFGGNVARYASKIELYAFPALLLNYFGQGAMLIARGSEATANPFYAMVDGWMQSPGHRANILQPAYREIGIGIVPAAPKKGVEGAAATYTTDFGSGD